jgi:protease-4
MTVAEKLPVSPPKKRPSPVWWVVGLLFWVALPLALGIWLSGVYVQKPQVGIIRLNTDIYVQSAEFVMEQINVARKNPRIQAVVVQIDSPGGEVAATQTIYLGLLDLRQKMPVVGSIDSIAASGAYYSAMAVEPLYAKPSSTVGNVGVWGYYPPVIGVNDAVLASGPFKLTASNAESFEREIEGIKREFLEVVRSQRGQRLKIATEDLAQGLAYPGRTALELGLIDQLGSFQDALDKAAEMAGLEDYEVVDLEALAIKDYLDSEYPRYPWYGAPDPETGERALPAGLYLLYDVRLGSTR